MLAIVAVLCLWGSAAGAAVLSTASARAWQVVPSADVSSTSADSLTSVSCVASGFCAAVGVSNSAPLIEIDNGGGWAVSPFADTSPPTLSTLSGVSCASAQFCLAVGDAESSGPAGVAVKVPAAESWNGQTWSVIPVPTNPVAAGLEYLDELTSVDCVSLSFCATTAVTEGVTFVGNEPTSQLEGYAETWNGSTWVSQQIGNQPRAISCSSTSLCAVVGTEGGAAAGPLTLGGDAFASVFGGSHWTTTEFPLPAGTENGFSGSTLDTVGCVGSWCLATGTRQLYKESSPGTYTPGRVKVVDAAYASGGWSSTSVPRPTVAPSGVFCTKKGACTGVGQCPDSTCGVVGSPLIEQLTHGAWSFVPLASAPVEGSLDAISCPSNSCAAVGDQGSSDVRTLAAVGDPTGSGQ